LLRRLFLLSFLAIALAGCLETRKEKIYVRRVPPTKEELDSLPPPEYESVLRRDAAERQRLEVPLELHDKTRWLNEGRVATSSAVHASSDPFYAYEKERYETLYRPWSDLGDPGRDENGKPFPPPPAPHPNEAPVEDDPFAPVQKTEVKKDEDKKDDAAPKADEKK